MSIRHDSRSDWDAKRTRTSSALQVCVERGKTIGDGHTSFLCEIAARHARTGTCLTPLMLCSFHQIPYICNLLLGSSPRRAGRLRRLPLRGRVARWNPARCMEADCRCLAVPHATPRREPCATRSPESGNAPPQTNTSAPDDKHSTNAPKRIYRFRADPCVGRNFRTYLRRGSHSPPQARTCCLCSTAILRLHWTGRRESTRVSLPVHSRRQLLAWRTEQRETMSSYTIPDVGRCRKTHAHKLSPASLRRKGKNDW